MKKNAYYSDYIYYEEEIYTNSYLLVENNIIKGITNNIDELSSYSITKFKNSAIFPGLINTHNHLGMGIMRGYADDLPLMTWLNDYIWPTERKLLSGEFVYYSTLLSLAESIASGVTCVNDMYFYANNAKWQLKKPGCVAILVLGVLIIFIKP